MSSPLACQPIVPGERGWEGTGQGHEGIWNLSPPQPGIRPRVQQPQQVPNHRPVSRNLRAPDAARSSRSTAATGWGRDSGSQKHVLTRFVGEWSPRDMSTRGLHMTLLREGSLWVSFGCRSRHEVILCWETLSPVTSVLKERTEEDSREAGPEVGQSRAASAGLCGQGLRPRTAAKDCSHR